MEIWFPTIDEGMPGIGDTVLGVGELACGQFKPKEDPAEVIEANVHVSWPDGRTHKFVELVPKNA